MEPEKLAGAMFRTLKGLNMELRAKEARAMALWSEVVGPVTAEKTRALYVNRGTMVVAVASSSWANQLQLLKNKLLIGLEERVGPGVIRDLRWKAGPWDEPMAPGVPGAAVFRRPPAPEPPEVSEAERTAIRRLTGEISNERLGGLVERALVAQAARRERLRAHGWVPCARCAVLYERREEGAHASLCPVCALEATP